MTNLLDKIINQATLTTRPYLPGKYVEDLSTQNIIKLASNENPLGPSKKAIEAMKGGMSNVCRYPDFNGNRLKMALSKHLNIFPEQLVLANGSNEALLLIAQLFLNANCEVIIPEYSFAVYEIATNLMGATPVITPTHDWQVDLDAIVNAITEKTRMIFLANPNNPTGILINNKSLSDFIKKIPNDIIIVIDEAYHEYAMLNNAYASMLPLIKAHSNLIVTRSFSKAYALAGLRLGYSISCPYIAEMVNRIRATFNVNHIAMVAGVASLEDTDFLNKTLEMHQKEYEKVKMGLEKLDLKYLPSAGNFITIDFQQPAQPIFEKLQKEGVIVRPLVGYQMSDCLRITIGLPKENKRFLTTLGSVTA